ncbi:unnamed protein product, partial [Coregonus sp. 'balchen']
MRVDELVVKVKMSMYKDHTYTEAFQSSPLIHIRDKVEDSTIRYSFDMFRFVEEPQDQYMHCTVRLYSPDDNEPCN